MYGTAEWYILKSTIFRHYRDGVLIAAEFYTLNSSFAVLVVHKPRIFPGTIIFYRERHQCSTMTSGWHLREKKHISRYENAHSRIYKTDSRLLRSSIANLHSAMFRCPSVITMRNVKAVRSSYKKLGRWKKVPEKPRNELYTLSWRACEIFKMVPVEAA